MDIVIVKADNHELLGNFKKLIIESDLF